ncbi:unnamed protein product [Mytilus coruscus]|uniref:LRAT domain-containing protein n=1 Tax=Mytilus coruscus TaxID=42192 RepID=A0A6J8CI58_MYTCO|nr:unnamed protein product [Mytilus coruscus]
MSDQTLVLIDSDIEDVNEGSIDTSVSSSDNNNQAIRDFTAFSEIIRNTDRTKYVHMKVKRKGPSSCCSYHHHFILIEFVHQGRNEIKVIVAHYTSSAEIITNNSRFGIGKFISETKVIERDKRNELIYDFGANNCEHAVNQILTGHAFSNEANSRQSCADICTFVLGEFKEVGLKVALIIALAISMEGSLTRYSYVRLMIAGVAAHISNIGCNETCSNLFGNNIIRKADNVLDKYNYIPSFSEIPSGEQIISDIKASLNNPLICKISEKLAWEALFLSGLKCMQSLSIKPGLEIRKRINLEKNYVDKNLIKRKLPFQTEIWVQVLIIPYLQKSNDEEIMLISTCTCFDSKHCSVFTHHCLSNGNQF